ATRTLIRNLTVVKAHAWAAPIPKRRQRDVLVTTLMVAFGWLLLFVFVGLVSRLDDLGAPGVLLAIVVESVANVLVWFIVCRRLPDRRRGWVDLVPGCLLFGVGLAVMNAISRVYLPARFEHSASLYGTLGIAGVILGWLLLIGQLLVVSALVNSILSDYRAERTARAARGAEESLAIPAE
ncbi:MAG: ribonuclease, partial [Frankiales bacterium]|nr:ribonuclease [Frankiales bacterium]